MAEPKNEIPKINPNEVEDLIQKFEQDKLEERDKQLITSLLRTLLTLAAVLQQKKISVQRLKNMLFGKKSEKRKKAEAEKEPSGGDSKGRDDAGSPGETKNEAQGTPGNSGRVRKPRHGRRAASAYPGAKKVRCGHRGLSSGARC